jgi:hypothetical protein
MENIESEWRNRIQIGMNSQNKNFCSSKSELRKLRNQEGRVRPNLEKFSETTVSVDA